MKKLIGADGRSRRSTPDGEQNHLAYIMDFLNEIECSLVVQQFGQDFGIRGRLAFRQYCQGFLRLVYLPDIETFRVFLTYGISVSKV